MNTVQYKCPNCGGELVFNPEKQMFSCPYCASDFTEAEMEEIKNFADFVRNRRK